MYFRLFLAFIFLNFVGLYAKAQLIGNKYIPGDYSSIGEAIDSLNLHGVGLGGVTFNIQAGYVESDSIPPINATGTANNPIVFQKDGFGNNPLIEYNNIASTWGAVPPFRLIGSDYITIQELSFENLLVNGTTGSTQAAVHLNNSSANDGCQHNTVQNCEFFNTRAVIAERGAVSSMDGTFSYNKIKNNNIQITQLPINSQNVQPLIGFNSMDDNYLDQENEIISNTINITVGGSSIALLFIGQDSFTVKDNIVNHINTNQQPSLSYSFTGFYLVGTGSSSLPISANKIVIENNIFNFENLSTVNQSSQIRGIEVLNGLIKYDSIIIRNNHIITENLDYPNLDGIFVHSGNNETNVLIEKNTINSNSSFEENLTGIRVNSTFNETVVSENNFVNITDSGNANIRLIVLNSSHQNSDYKIFGNIIQNIEKISSHGNITGISFNGTAMNCEINDNIFSNLTNENNITAINGNMTLTSESIQNNQFHDFSASGSIFGIHNESYAENSTISGNEMYNFNSIGIVGGMLFNNQDENGIRNIANNEIYNLESDSSIVILDVNGGNNTIENNNLYEATIPNTSAQGDLLGLAISKGDLTLNNNQVNNLTHLGEGNIFGIKGTDSLLSETIQNNQFHDFSASGNIFGIHNESYTENSTISDNEMHSFISSGVINGLFFDNQDENGTRNITNNEIYNFDADSSITLLSISGGENTVNENQLYNHEIVQQFSTGDLIGVHFQNGQVNLSNNQIHNYTHRGVGDLYGILGTDSTSQEIIQHNLIHDLTSINGGVIGIKVLSYAENSEVSENEIYNLTGFGHINGGSFNNEEENGIRAIFENKIYNLQSDSSITVLEINGGQNTVEDNSIYEGLVSNTSSQGDLIGFSFSEGEFELNNNIIYNFSHQGEGVLTGISSNGVTFLETLNNNLVYDLSANNSASGLQLKSEGNERHISENEIYDIDGQNQAFGAKFFGANTTFNRNKIYNISSDGSTGKSYGVSAIQLDTLQFSNNLIGSVSADFSNDLNGVVGVHLDSLENAAIFFNSVVLTGENNNQDFGSSSIYLGEEANHIDLRNNIFINKTQSNGNGVSVALRLADEDLDLLSSNNDNNLYFIDTTENNAAFFYDGVNSDYTFNDFKSRMSFREQNSALEDVLFESLSGSSVDFLRPDNTVPTFIESNAQEIIGFEDDFHFLQVRTGYPLSGQVNGGGEQPDIGAIEGDYIPNFTSVANNTLKENQISIYPNPAVDQVFVQTKGLENYQLTITDVHGKVLLEENVTNEVQKVDVSGFAKGVYVFSVGKSILRQKKVVIN